MILSSARDCLTAYLPQEPHERGFRGRMLELLGQGAPFSRSSFDPGHLTASAFVLAPDGDALLLILHKKLQIWIQPGGHIEVDDQSLHAAARREVSEEVGLALAQTEPAAVFDLDIHPIPAHGSEPAHEHFDVRFWFQSATRDHAASDEVLDARWVELSKIDQVTADESVLRAARKLLRMCRAR